VKRVGCNQQDAQSRQVKRVPKMRAMVEIRAAVLILFAALSACSTPAPVQPAQRATSPKSDALNGVWVLTVESPMGRDDMEARLEQTGQRLSGHMHTAGSDVPLQGTVKGEAIRFDMSLTVRGQALKLEYAGIVQGDQMAGTVQFGPMGMGRFFGLKKSRGTDDKPVP
jgi:hypothetical protein